MGCHAHWDVRLFLSTHNTSVTHNPKFGAPLFLEGLQLRRILDGAMELLGEEEAERRQ